MMNMKVDEVAVLESGDVTLPAMKWSLREEQVERLLTLISSSPQVVSIVNYRAESKIHDDYNPMPA